jgi:hypothetical protein
MEVGPNFPVDPGAAGAARAEVSLPIRSLKSVDLEGKSFSAMLDGMSHQALHADTWPKAFYCLTELVRARTTGHGPPYAFESKGQLSLAGVTNLVSMPVQVEPGEGENLKIVGSALIKMSAYKIVPPLPANVDPGPLKYEDEVRVSFEWLLQATAVRTTKHD